MTNRNFATAAGQAVKAGKTANRPHYLVADHVQGKLRTALAAIRDGFAVFDRDHKLIYANASYTGLFRDGPQVALGQSYDQIICRFGDGALVDLGGLDPQDWQMQMIERVSRSEIPPIILPCISGHFLKFTDQRGPDGDLVCTVSDVTDIVRRESELEEARARAEAANRAKSSFLANMSHEIRTPMNGVVGMAELLCDTSLTDEQRLFAETIRSSGEALLRIINDVLDYSKAEAEKLKLYPEPFDLERCIHEVMLLLQPLASEKGVSLLVDFDLFLPTRFVADPGRMRQILTNLLGNAVKFTNKGHVLARVVGIELSHGIYELHITVEDTGIGIAPEHIGHIFGEFNQVEDQANRKFEGAGLGLAITRQLVDLMGGEIWVDSVPGKGSCFGFKIQFAGAEPMPEEPEYRPITLRSALVVDEAIVSRKILCRQLENFGLSVQACQTAADALGLLRAGERFDLIIADQVMQQVDGQVFAAGVRSLGIDAPILLQSMSPMRIHASANLLQGVLQKPIQRSDLFRRLQELSNLALLSRSQEAQAQAEHPDRFRKVRVLAAEDNKTNQLVFSKMVQEFDIELQFASNGREAFELWRAFRPDMIFMDISMPEVDGREATRAIRQAEDQDGRGEHVPIIALTAHALTGDSDSILAAGVDHYLTKPLKKVEIAEKIRSFDPRAAQAPTDELKPTPGV